MASRSRRLLLLLAVSAAALQVTPNSPCSSACIDSAGLDASDPNSSNTRAGDIVCADGQFDADAGADAAGRKLRTCLACLQGSTYTQGGEGDQAWFLYNLRYAFDRCVFGYPNANATGATTSSPCVTPESCGALAAALKSDIARPGAVSAFAYCDVDAGAATGVYFESCLQCVQADGQHAYLSNFLVVLEAACLQRPPASLLVGVNETVFSRHAIAVTQPSPPASSSPPPASHAALSTPAIVGVAMAGVAALALLSGCAYMQVRKRQNRRSRARRTLSFRCQTAAAAAAPPAPAYHDDDDDYDDERFFEKRRGSRDASVVVSMSPVARSKPCAWPLNITTTTTAGVVPAPEPAYVSPVSAGGASSPDDATPRSSAPLLSPARAFASHRLHFAGGAGHAPARPPGSPVQVARIQTTFDPPPTR